MKLGIIGRADPSGLGYMTIDFLRHMHHFVSRVLIINLSNRGATDITQIHAALPTKLVDEISDEDVNNFISGNGWLVLGGAEPLDAVVGFETFYNHNVLPICYRHNVKTILFPMWECTPVNLDICDVLFCVSDRDKQEYPHGIRLDWPVCESEFHGRLRRKPPRNFVNCPGSGGLNNRNNSDFVVAAGKLLRKPAQLITNENKPHRFQLYEGADVFIHLQAFAGLSLPLQEAAFCRIPSLVLDIEGFQHYPPSMRIEPLGSEVCRIGGKDIRYWRPNSLHLAKVMNELASGKREAKLPPKPSTWDNFYDHWCEIFGVENASA